MNVLFKYFMNNVWDIQAKQRICKWASKKGAGAWGSDRGIGLGFGGGYRKITDSTSHPRIHVKVGNFGFIDRLLRCRRILEEGETVPESDRRFCERFFTIKETPKRGKKVIPNEENIASFRERDAGFLVLISNCEKDPVKCLKITGRRRMRNPDSTT